MADEVTELRGELADLVRAITLSCPKSIRDAIWETYVDLREERKPKRGGYTHGKRKEVQT